MVLCQWRLRLAPPNPLALVPGLGPVGSCLVVTHFNRFGMRRLAGPVAGWWSALTVLGLDERTAVVGQDGVFAVIGQGAATRFFAGAGVRCPPGTELDLPYLQ
jgi:cyanophycinase-like exopeptidase